MEYQKTNVNAFLGLDNNSRPELIKDQEASDIENLRFEKLGYLINRNGADNKGINLSRITDNADRPGELWGIGSMGLTEYVITKPWGVGSGTESWAPYDDNYINIMNPAVAGNKFTDRFMVYCLRLPARIGLGSATDPMNYGARNQSNLPDNTINRYTWRYKAAYLLVPLTGADNWRDVFAFAPNGFKLDTTVTPPYQVRDNTLPTLFSTVGSRIILRADDKPSKLQIYAPSRWLGVHNTFASDNTAKDLNWIEHYVTMNQYRDALVISDMTNGDMLLVDEYSESEYAETKRHRFTLRENALAKFDVDDVVVDFGIGGDNFNQQGVESPMALYRFYLTRSRFQSTGDNYTPYYADRDESPEILRYRSEIRKWRTPIDTSVFISTEYWKAEVDGGSDIHVAGITIDKETKYIFSNNQDADEYDDLFSHLTLDNPEIKKDKQSAADIYLWEDQKIKYYPVSGKEQGSYFLRAIDRTWDKSSSGGTKLIELMTKAGVEQKVPLGVWRYRFVWYMGNGEYSAPSAELVVPDLLFSGLQDGDIIASYGSYKRPIGIETYGDAERTNLQMSSTGAISNPPYFINDTARAQGAAIFGANNGGLTGYGSNFLKIKEALFDPGHVFSAKYSSTTGAAWPSNWLTESVLAKGQVSVVCTLHFLNDDMVLSGVAVEGAQSYIKAEDAVGTATRYEYKSTDSYFFYTLPLRIPLFSKEAEGSHTYNSIFTKYGIPRTIYQNSARNSASPLYDNNALPPFYPAYQIVFEGAQRYGAENYDVVGNGGNGFLGSNVLQNGGGVWFNLVTFKGGYALYSAPPAIPLITIDKNNEDDENIVTGAYKAYDFRNMTSVRAVKNENDRLLFIKPGIPAEVLSRIVLSGSGEIPLCDFGDRGSWISQKKWYPTFGTDILVRTNTRVHLSVNNSDWYTFDSIFSGIAVNSFSEYIYTKNISNADPMLHFTNLRVVISAPGERLTIPEQLSMYIPASLLFEAPRVKLFIPANRVPRRARQLLIFRTRASHDNAWQPHEYGLVKSVDIIRDGTTWALTGTQVNGIEYLDDVKSSELDYSYSLPDYDGFVEPIKSRFCLPLNERVFYSNIKEAYKPHAPRNSVKIEAVDPTDTFVLPHKNKNVGTDTSLERLWSYKVFTPAEYAPGQTATNTTNIPATSLFLYYFVAYNDQARSYSLAGFSGGINRLSGQNKVVLFGLPSAYDPAIEQLNIYRLALTSALTPLTFSAVSFQGGFRYRTPVAPATGSYYVAQGIVEYQGVAYYPNSVIQVQFAGDTGWVDAAAGNLMYSYFVSNAADTDRGNAWTYNQPIVYRIDQYTDQATGVGPWIERIGTIQPEAEGIFYDDDLPALGRLPLKQFFQNEDAMPSALRWSEPYQPNKIKLGSLMEVRAGDGDQITGMAMLYGNLIVMKERSIHRLAVQGSTVPVSRVDEISNNVGCIAPNTVITVNNTLYFLSWSGFYKYDNNVLSKIDGKFAEELQLRLRSAQNGVSNPAIRDASCGWNSAYRELYLNIPVMTTSNNEGDADDANLGGVEMADNKGARSVRGHIYAINMDTGLVTKHRYMDDSTYFTDPTSWYLQPHPLAPTQRAPRVYSRIYSTNSLGQLRSAEILPPRTKNFLLAVQPVASTASMQFMRSSMFIESPTKDVNNRDKPSDDYLAFVTNPIAGTLLLQATKFVRIFWASKDWTAEDKSVLKRIRKVFSYIAASDDPVILRGIVHTSPMGSTATTDTAWQYTYVDSRPASPRLNYSVTGEIMAVPTESAGSASSPSQNRGERHTFHVEGSGAFQMEYFGFYWKPINQYER